MDKATAEEFLLKLQQRFAQHMQRHAGIDWLQVSERLLAQPAKLQTLWLMEQSGGEPDVIGQDPEQSTFLFCDCAAESPAGRRSLCYDQAALDKRKENKPAGAAVAMASAFGAELLTEQQYRALQQLGQFDQKTSSWLSTPAEIRALGGAIFGDRRYNRVFVYHNGAESYYAARGFRLLLKV
ncbi:DUF4256 domain-containing protein [Rheinheimera sp. 4Y26]|uniref:DUF4256 domain-containing protein n=1 Tax=Rheinheimera sp. 4Y26 TaxID=2977811 RepID=UPI0021B09214|nr:DUF4256 domain-containing protein [Rheinheimera sp. 4Y26]MCT6698110.1 DUF4256 domain-containing protein [Rheinheimera sp. 4Y26]